MSVILSHWGGRSTLQFCDRFTGPCARWRHIDAKNTFASNDGKECRSFSTYGNALRFLQDFALKGDTVKELRSLLSRDVLLVWRLEDHEVLSKCAHLLTERRLCVMPAINLNSTSIFTGSESFGQESSETKTSETPSSFKSRANEVNPNPNPPIELSPLAQIDQDRQAETLVHAARNGMAFCEECKKAARQ